MRDGFPMHVVCGFGAGATALMVGSPVDVLKTRIMNRPTTDKQSVPSLIAQMITKEGPLAFYKGFTANFMRLGSWNVMIFCVLEKIKALFPTID